jgi:hypothetical protein
LASWIRIPNPDPDPLTRLNPDPNTDPQPCNKERFVTRHLAETMAYIYRCLQGRDRDRYSALMAIGLIAVVAGREIKPYLQNILVVLRYQNLFYFIIFRKDFYFRLPFVPATTMFA